MKYNVWQKIEWCIECLQPLQHKPYVFTQGNKDIACFKSDSLEMYPKKRIYGIKRQQEQFLEEFVGNRVVGMQRQERAMVGSQAKSHER